MTPRRSFGDARCDVLTVTPWFGSSIGGVETHVSEVTARHRDVLRVRIAACDATHALPHSDTIRGIAVDYAPAWPRATDVGFAPKLARIIRRVSPQLVHVQGAHTMAAPIAMLTALFSHVPYVVTFHSGGHSKSWRNHIRSLQWRLLRPLFCRAEALVAVSEFEKQQFVAALRVEPERIDVIPNGVDVEMGRCRVGPRHGPLRVLSIGRLEQYKGHHRVIAAWREIERAWPGSTLTIVGVGPDEAELRREATEAAPDSIEFKAFSRDERSSYFELVRSADVVLVLSEYESQGLVVLEALACGADVVVQNTSALAEYVGRGMAVGVRADASGAQIVDAVMLAVTRPPPEVELPSWDECADRLLTLYRSTGLSP